MRAVVASNTGIVKVFDTKQHKVVQQWGKATKDDEVTKMIWADTEQTKVLIGRKTGSISTHSIDSGVIEAGSSYKLDGKITALQTLSNSRVLACTETGEIGIFSEGKKLEEYSVNRTIETMIYSSSLVSGCQAAKSDAVDGRLVISGGDGQLAQMLDLETKKMLWTARNVPLDFLDMEVPIHDKSLAWIDPNHTFLCVTAYKHLRVYDIRAQRKPTVTVEYGERPFVCCAVNPLATNIAMVSDTAANLTALDLRRNFLCLGMYKGIAGAVRSIAYHETQPVVAAVGLDRYLHIYNTTTRAHIEKVYLKQRLNSVLFASSVEQPEKEDEKEEEEEEEEVRKGKEEDLGSLLKSLPTVTDEEKEGQNRKRKRSKSASNPPSKQKRRISK